MLLLETCQTDSPKEEQARQLYKSYFYFLSFNKTFLISMSGNCYIPYISIE